MRDSWQEFAQKLREAMADFVRGNAEPYIALWSRAENVSVFAAFGGSELGWEAVYSRLEWAASQYRDWTYEDIVVAEHAGAEIGYRVHVARIRNLAQAGPPVERERRITHILVKESGTWRIAHVHSDSLASALPVQNASTSPSAQVPPPRRPKR